MAKSVAYIAVVLILVAGIIGIAAASLSTYFTAKINYKDFLFNITTEVERGPFKKCESVDSNSGLSGGDCGQSTSNCQIIYYGNLVQVFMLYDGECTYLNISRAFIVLGILGAIFSVIFVTYSLIKRLGDQGSYIFYGLCLASFAFVMLCFMLSFAGVVMFVRKIDDSFTESTTTTFSTQYGAAFALTIVGFVFSLAATAVFAWFGRPSNNEVKNVYGVMA